jgi:protein-S-isoprenylcysteine O-methyltransferase Ste14
LIGSRVSFAQWDSRFRVVTFSAGEWRSSLSFEATEFEFRYRFWIFAVIFWVSFWLYFFDHVNVAEALARLLLGAANAQSPRLDRYVRAIFAAGTLVVTLGASIRTWAEAYLHSTIVHDSKLHASSVVADGPYRHLRNPLYLGTIVLSIGVGTLASRTGFLVLLASMFVFNYRLILREEANLLQTQGENYRRYFDAVPRLFPSLSPRLPASGAKPNWGDAFSGEIFMWSPAAAMLVFTITERLSLFWIVFGAGFAIYFLQEFLRSRARKNSPAA